MLRLELRHLDQHLAAQPPTFVGFRRDCLVELLYQLQVVPARNRKRARYLAAEPRAYMPLSTQVLRQWLPEYRHYLDYALASSLIETDNHYMPKYKCIGYRYAAPFRRDGPLAGFRVVRLRDAVQLARLHKLHTTPPAPKWSRRARKDYAPALDCLHTATCGLCIHTAAALAFIAAERDAAERDPSKRETKRKRRRKARPRPATPAAAHARTGKASAASRPARMQRRQSRGRQTPEAETKDPAEQYQQRFTSIAQLDARDFRYAIDPYGRLHTVLTRLSKSLRPFVYLAGRSPLVAIDLSCSQPYLVNLLLNPTFFDQPWKKGRRGAHPPLTIWQEGRSLAEEAAEEQQVLVTRQLAERQTPPRRSTGHRARQGRRGQPDPPSPDHTAYYVMRCRQLLGINSQGFAQLRPDVEEFRRLTSSGQFYEHMQARLGLALGQTAVSRDKVKEMMFQVMFTHNAVESPSKAAFSALFPTVDAVLRTLKRKRHQHLATLLQRLESELFIRRLVPLIRRKWPDLAVFSVHDSVIIESTHVAAVEALMHQHLTRWVGVPPQFKREAWGGETPPPASNLPPQVTA